MWQNWDHNMDRSALSFMLQHHVPLTNDLKRWQSESEFLALGVGKGQFMGIRWWWGWREGLGAFSKLLRKYHKDNPMLCAGLGLQGLLDNFLPTSWLCAHCQSHSDQMPLGKCESCILRKVLSSGLGNLMCPLFTLSWSSLQDTGPHSTGFHFWL